MVMQHVALPLHSTRVPSKAWITVCGAFCMIFLRWCSFHYNVNVGCFVLLGVMLGILFLVLFTIWPSRAATKQTRPPLKNDPFREPKDDSAAAIDITQPQLPRTLLLFSRTKKISVSKAVESLNNNMLILPCHFL